MIKIKRIVLAMVFGVLIGGLGALLLAPQSGQETREVLRDKQGRFRARVQGDDEARGEESTRNSEET